MGMVGLLCGAIFSLALGLATVGVSRILIVWMLEEMQAEWRFNGCVSVWPRPRAEGSAEMEIAHWYLSVAPWVHAVQQAIAAAVVIVGAVGVVGLIMRVCRHALQAYVWIKTR